MVSEREEWYRRFPSSGVVTGVVWCYELICRRWKEEHVWRSLVLGMLSLRHLWDVHMCVCSRQLAVGV